jgi:hypothetical protein
MEVCSVTAIASPRSSKSQGKQNQLPLFVKKLVILVQKCSLLIKTLLSLVKQQKKKSFKGLEGKKVID